jgi:hypothetical protein
MDKIKSWFFMVYINNILNLPTSYFSKSRVKSITTSLVTAPFKITLGLVQTIVLSLLLIIRGSFYKSGIKGYFIDNFILLKDNHKYEKAKKTHEGNPKYAFLKIEPFEAIKLEHKDGKKRPWIVYVPGITSNLILSLSSVENIHNAGYNVICLNNYGIGGSNSLKKKVHTVDTLSHPVMAAYRYLKNENVIFWGHSMGGAIAALAAAKSLNTPIDIILDRSFNRLTDTVKYGPKYFFFPFNRLVAFIAKKTIPFDTGKIIPGLKGNIVTISHHKDEMIHQLTSAKTIIHSDIRHIELENDDFTELRKNTPAPIHISLLKSGLIQRAIRKLRALKAKK